MEQNLEKKLVVTTYRCGCKLETEYRLPSPSTIPVMAIVDKKTLCEKHQKEKDNQLTPREKNIYTMLDLMIDELGEANVDISYFPEKADRVLIKYAKELNRFFDDND